MSEEEVRVQSRLTKIWPHYSDVSVAHLKGYSELVCWHVVRVACCADNTIRYK